MGRTVDLHRPVLRAIAGLGAARRRHFRDVVLAVPDRQFHLGADLVGRPAAGRRRDGQARRMAVAGGGGGAWNKIMTGGFGPTSADPSIFFFSWPDTPLNGGISSNPPHRLTGGA